jgi:hypothetical protein
MAAQAPRTFWQGNIRLAWTIMAQLRFMFHVELHPCMSTAFVMLHYYFRANEKPRYPLYVLITCCSLASLKSFECMKTMQRIFVCVLDVCRSLRNAKNEASLQQVLGISDFADRPLTQDEIVSMNQCEIDILKAHSFQAKLDLSFDFTEKFVDPVLAAAPNGGQTRDRISKHHCYALLSTTYLDYHTEAIAVAVTRKVLGDGDLPNPVAHWIADATGRHTPGAIEAAMRFLEQQQKLLEKGQQA